MMRSTQTTNEFQCIQRSFDAPLALVTGASGGIGGCCAKTLAGLGYATLIVGRSLRDLGTVADDINNRFGDTHPCFVYRADLANRQEVALLLTHLESFKAPEVFVSAAGVTSNSTETFDEHELDEVFAVNTIAPMYLARGILPLMENGKGGYIINIASRAGVLAFSDKGVYGASKASTIRYFDALYVKSLNSDIRVTSICPGWVNTPMAKAGGCTKPSDDLLQPDDISAAIGWLVSSPSRVRIRELVIEAGGKSQVTA
ncbi:SDR family NAD(P)-dependent oxidoreductase [Paraburkholderia sediminicola]|uniref:SDR family NAD(P)-dependent oxidoreductase n=1 Tax=Paraburkholderia sediminicola TaxID=458836 RepID=UPI0038B730F1